ncbi:hypothetical protein [Clostridium sp. ZBS18]|uniref:hypothetical protein n=1 Tax=Clostridium sp. ZBS18 TaxID=2949967 RepID=UPI002079C07A|nr:hypothetical protein [Clostridium sp. ZBS18]
MLPDSEKVLNDEDTKIFDEVYESIRKFKSNELVRLRKGDNIMRKIETVEAMEGRLSIENVMNEDLECESYTMGCKQPLAFGAIEILNKPIDREFDMFKTECKYDVLMAEFNLFQEGNRVGVKQYIYKDVIIQFEKGLLYIKDFKEADICYIFNETNY